MDVSRRAPTVSLKWAQIRLFALTLVFAISADAQQSVCFGTVSNGRLENGVRLPDSGPNFSTYTGVASTLGRTYVHSRVHAVMLDAYAAVQKTMPDVLFVYGETGWKKGGRISPHRTHQNGLSVDFMVPIRDKNGKSVSLPTNALNKYGYDIEFDSAGRYAGYQIDYSALAEHLFQLKRAATAQGADIAQVIFDPQLMPRLFGTARGPYLKENVKFMKGKPWVRHDEHYHVDFAVRCLAMPK